MDLVRWQAFWGFGIFAIVLFIAGFYCLIMTRNLMRALVGAEFLMKAVTLIIIAAGYATGNIALAQSVAITLIVIEVIVIAVACCMVLNIFRYHDSLDSRNIANLKG